MSDSKRCLKGKSCSATCISRSDICTKDLDPSTGTQVSKMSKFLKEQLPHQAEHVGISVVAWKVGKVLGPTISGYLESHYGIPRETTQMLSESVIQGATATALNSKHMKSAKGFVESLLVETSAALLGKSAHSGAEAALASVNEEALVKSFGPLLAGKLTGISVATGGSKVGAIAGAVVDRSRKDVEKLRRFFSQSVAPNFAETSNDEEALSRSLADLALISLYLSLRNSTNAPV